MPISQLVIQPVFIGGCPRSGTTMLGSILGSGAGCVVTPESHFKQTIPLSISPVWNKGMPRDVLLNALQQNFRFKIWHTPLPPDPDLPEVVMPSDYGRLIDLLVDQYAQKNGLTQSNIWIDHTPQNIQNPLMLLCIFPNAKFIHLVRDPRAVAASVLPLDWGPHSADEAALFWAQKLSYGLAFEQSHPDRCMRVHYEKIVSKPEDTIRKICNFCDISYNSLMLNGALFTVPKYSRKQHKLVGSRPDPKRIDLWKRKLDLWQISRIENLIGDLIVMMGYELSLDVRCPRRPLLKKFSSRLLPLLSYIKTKRHQLKKRFYV